MNNESKDMSDDELFAGVPASTVAAPYSSTLDAILEAHDLMYIKTMAPETLKRLMYLPENSPEWQEVLRTQRESGHSGGR